MLILASNHPNKYFQINTYLVANRMTWAPCSWYACYKFRLSFTLYTFMIDSSKLNLTRLIWSVWFLFQSKGRIFLYVCTYVCMYNLEPCQFTFNLHVTWLSQILGWWPRCTPCTMHLIHFSNPLSIHRLQIVWAMCHAINVLFDIVKLNGCHPNYNGMTSNSWSL